MRIGILVLFLTITTTSLAKAEETYFCYLDKFMEIGNDGRFYGTEATDEKMILNVKDKKVSINLFGLKADIPLIEKLGTIQFAAKGGIASMTTLHVWKNGKSNDYDVQYTMNYAKSVTIRTGSCILNE